MNKIAAIVVTYNRKECLLDCLIAIERQTMLPDMICIIDNHSSDGTAKLLMQKGYICNLPDTHSTDDTVFTLSKSSIIIKYIYKCSNTGSGGGQYTGMKASYEEGYEWFWMMDDDGIPTDNALEELYVNSVKYHLHFANSLVIDKVNTKSLAFNNKTIDDYRNIEIIYNEII
jgi:GT2 family glycosyltransferase